MLAGVARGKTLKRKRWKKRGSNVWSCLNSCAGGTHAVEFQSTPGRYLAL